jgi:hypothetical protein
MARGTGALSPSTAKACLRGERVRGQRPLLLLDVDGVLCPTEAAPGYTSVRIQAGCSLWVSEANRARLALLAEAFELVWATSWEERANNQIGPLHGLAPLSLISFPGGFTRPGWNWKLRTVRRVTDEQRPLAWLDDELDFVDVTAWAASRPAPTLLISPLEAVGLTDAHVDELLRFAAALPTA